MATSTVDAPFSLAGLFVDEPEDEHLEDVQAPDARLSSATASASTSTASSSSSSAVEPGSSGFQQLFECSTVVLAGVPLQVRQFAFHATNANQVWPSTFAMAEYLSERLRELRSRRILELGAATGALSMWLVASGVKDITTSDLAPAEGEPDEILENLRQNFAANGLPAPPHIPHTWGQPWPPEVAPFEVVLGSDLLLYVSAYPALVRTLCTLLLGSAGRAGRFLMAWRRRRIHPGPGQPTFFEQMARAGFACQTVGRGLFEFTPAETAAASAAASNSAVVPTPDGSPDKPTP